MAWSVQAASRAWSSAWVGGGEGGRAASVVIGAVAESASMPPSAVDGSSGGEGSNRLRASASSESTSRNVLWRAGACLLRGPTDHVSRACAAVPLLLSP